MKREFATLAHSFHGDKSKVEGWFKSRKLNGWGCLWDGGVTRGVPAYKIPWYFMGGDDRLKGVVKSTGLWTIGRADKYGIRPKTIQAPDWFLDLLPKDIPLQGEIWKDDNLSEVKSICGCTTEDKKNDPRWRDVRFIVYNYKPFSCWVSDCLNGTFKGGLKNFPPYWLELADRFLELKPGSFYYNIKLEERLLRLQLHAPAIESEVCSILDQSCNVYLGWFLETAKELGWEGVMLANPNAFYEQSRSHNLLKVKAKNDAEAVVTGYAEGRTGKNIGKMGALEVSMTWGEEVLSIPGGTQEMVGKTVYFAVSGFTDTDRQFSVAKEKYPIGKAVHFTFNGVTIYGIPQSCNIDNSI
jgi:hypothetical protein